MNIVLRTEPTLNKQPSKYYRPSILVVEDSSIVQKIHKFYLDKMHCDTVFAADGAKALGLLNNNYDLILLDIGLPLLNGISLATEIRRREQEMNHLHIPIIAITVYSPEDIAVQCYRVGINEIMFKPVSYESFRETLLSWLPSLINNDYGEQA